MAVLSIARLRRRAVAAGRAVIRCAAAALCALLCAGAGASALCPPAQCQYVLLHPRAAGACWDSLLSETDIVAPDTMCSLAPARMHLAGNHPQSWAVFSTASNALFLVDIVWQRAPSFCGKPSFVVGTPRRLPVTLAAGAPFYVVNHPEFRDDAILLAVGVTASLVQVYTIATVNGGITGIAMVMPVPANAAQAVTGIAGDADTLGGTDNGVWLTGPGGLARHVAFDGVSWGTEQTADVDSAHAISAIAEGLAGTVSGHVYSVQGDSLVLQGRPTTASILGISRRWAVGTGGTVLVREGISWQSYTAGAAAYRRALRVAHPNGSAVELLDTAWNRTRYVYRDSVTTFSSFDPPGLAACVNAAVCSAQTGTLRLGLADPDSNRQLPTVAVHGEWGSTGDLLVNAEGDTLRPALPHIPSSYGGIRFNDTAITLIVSDGWVGLRVPVLRSTVVPGCTTTYWASDTFFANATFDWGDTLLIALGSDTLRLGPDQAVVTRDPASMRPSRTDGGLLFVDRSGRLLAMPAAAGAAWCGSVHDLTGRVVWRGAVEAGRSRVNLPFELPRTVLVVKLRDRQSGRTLSRAFALIP